MSYNGSNRGYGANRCLIEHMKKFIGEDVLIFTTSGGASGSGFQGILLEINCDFVRLLSQQGSPPSCPISNVCAGNPGICSQSWGYPGFRTGSVCDIPFDKIVSFTHNAI